MKTRTTRRPIKSRLKSTSKPPKKLVRIAGLEPARLAALPPQSSVSANSTISATRHKLKHQKLRTQADFGSLELGGRILTPPPHPRPIPSPHDGEVGRGLGRGDSKERDNSMERAPLPPPSPARASQGEGAGDFSDGGSIKMRHCPSQR